MTASINEFFNILDTYNCDASNTYHTLAASSTFNTSIKNASASSTINISINNENNNVKSRPKSSRSRSEGVVIKQELDTSVFTNHNMTATSITIRTPAPVPGTTLSPTAKPVTISYINDDSH